MQKIWILAADSTRARIFERATAGEPFHEIEDFFNHFDPKFSKFAPKYVEKNILKLIRNEMNI